MAGPPFGKDRIPKTLGWNALLVLAALTQISWPLSEFSCGVEAAVYMHKHGGLLSSITPARSLTSYRDLWECEEKAKGRVWKMETGRQSFIHSAGIYYVPGAVLGLKR